MGRIRTIKPEFPQSESVGRLSRDARLLFIQLWTLVDDEGIARASSRVLASLLYPYDDGITDLIEGWLTELEKESCIRRYVVDGNSYLQIVNWLDHQKIDKPTKTKFPKFAESSRVLAKGRGVSGREGKGEEGSGGLASPPEEITPEMVAMGVRTELGLGGTKTLMVLEDVCRSELEKGGSPEDLRKRMCDGWAKYEESRPRLEWTTGAEKFFADGLWRNPDGWPWRDRNPTPKREYIA